MGNLVGLSVRSTSQRQAICDEIAAFCSISVLLLIKAPRSKSEGVQHAIELWRAIYDTRSPRHEWTLPPLIGPSVSVQCTTAKWSTPRITRA